MDALRVLKKRELLFAFAMESPGKVDQALPGPCKSGTVTVRLAVPSAQGLVVEAKKAFKSRPANIPTLYSTADENVWNEIGAGDRHPAKFL
jgi:hypothetical protein